MRKICGVTARKTREKREDAPSATAQPAGKDYEDQLRTRFRRLRNHRGVSLKFACAHTPALTRHDPQGRGDTHLGPQRTTTNQHKRSSRPHIPY